MFVTYSIGVYDVGAACGELGGAGVRRGVKKRVGGVRLRLTGHVSQRQVLQPHLDTLQHRTLWLVKV